MGLFQDLLGSGQGQPLATPTPLTSMSQLSSAGAGQGIDPNSQGGYIDHSHGIFTGGVKNIIGNILGSVLMGPRWMDQKADAGHISDAMQHLQDDPQTALANIAKYNPQMAEQLYGSQMLGQYRNNVLGIRQQTVDNSAKKTQLMGQGNVIKSIGGAVTGISDPATYDQFHSAAEKRLAAVGLTPEDIGMPATYDADALSKFSSGTSSAHQQFLEDAATGRLDEQKDWHNRLEPILSGNMQAHQTQAAASASQADSKASEVDSTNDKNNAQARAAGASADRAYGTGGTIQTGTKPTRARPGQAPAAPQNSDDPSSHFDPTQYPGRTINGGQWKSDGKRWIRQTK